MDESVLALAHRVVELASDKKASDIVLRPRLYTAFFDPFAPHPTLALLCGHFGRDGEPLPESPDTILRRAQERVRAEAGIETRSVVEMKHEGKALARFFFVEDPDGYKIEVLQRHGRYQ